MIFANGEVKEGLFLNGVFKMDGNEQDIKRYIKKNKLIPNDALDRDHSDNQPV